MTPSGIVITVFRGGCQVVSDDRVADLRLVGRHAERELALAVGDEISFDPEKGIVLDRLPRRTQLTRHRRRGEQVIAANMDQLAVVASFLEPTFRSGAVDRFLLAAYAGGLEAILVVNKLDLLAGGPVPEEVQVYERILPVYPLCALTGEGLAPLREKLRRARTVLAGHSGVGKTTLLNALEPELRLETADVTGAKRGRHTTARAIWIRLPGDAVVVDTPGLREIAAGPVDPRLLDEVYPDVAKLAVDCRFRDCRHDREPDCAVRAAAERAELPLARIASFQRLIAEIDAERRDPSQAG